MKKLIMYIGIAVAIAAITVIAIIGCNDGDGEANDNVNSLLRGFDLTEYTVTFSGEGNEGGDAHGAVVVRVGTVITLPDRGTMIKDGYSFDGWHIGETRYQIGFSYTVTGDVAFYATWKLNVPEVPTNVNATATSTSSITVRWSSVPRAAGYKVYRSTNADGAYSLVESSTSTTYTDNGLSASTTYYYKVSAYNSAGDGELSFYASVMTQMPPASNVPDVPTNIVVTVASASSITVSWSSVSGAAGYRVYRSTSASGTYSQVGSTTTSISYTNNGLSASTTYYYKVSAYNNAGESALSSYAYAAIPSNNSFTDSRNNKTYKTVVVEGKRWMAENLNYQTSNSWCYDQKNSECDKYGRLYTWEAAKIACPTGWHLSSSQEWSNLRTAAGGSSSAGKKLKSTYGWNNSGNGTNDLGFSALPGGYYSYDDNSFYGTGIVGNWWTGAEKSSGNAYYCLISGNNNNASEGNKSTSNGMSVRCVQD